MPVETVEDLGVFFGFFLTVLIVLGQFFLKKRDRKNHLVVAAFSSIALYQFSRSFHFFSGLPNWYAWFRWIYILGMFSIFLAVPLAYMLFTSVIEKEYEFTRKSLLHFIIPVLAALVLILFAGFPENPGGIPRDYTEFLYTHVEIIRLVDILSMVLFFSYFIKLIIRNHRLYFRTPGKNRKNFLLLLVFTSIATVLCSFYIFAHMNLKIIGTIFHLRFTIMAIFIFLTSYSNPILLNISRLESRRDYYQKSYIDNLNADKIISSLETLMNDRYFIADEELTINLVAHRLGITRHQLSEIINLRLHKTYNQYLREKRLAYAKELLMENPSRKIIWIANECGFNAISNFNSSFKSMYGMTPCQFRKTAAV